MDIAIASFSTKGRNLESQLKEFFLQDDENTNVFCYDKNNDKLSSFVKKHMEQKHSMIFIGACGIAVRLIAPFVQNKLTDSSVIVVDETAHFVIPILSGHVGGANMLARRICAGIGALCVITTATDLEDKFAIDVYAKDHDLTILDKDGIVYVSSKILNGEEVTVLCDDEEIIKDLQKVSQIKLIQKLDDIKDRDNGTDKNDEVNNKIDIDLFIGSYKEAMNVKAKLSLIRQRYVAGMGCKKGKSFEELIAFFKESIDSLDIHESEVRLISSIDLKKDEAGLCKLSLFLNIPFETYSADKLNMIEGEFSTSDFVKEITGCDNVSERAALYAAKKYGQNAKIILPKNAKCGMTISIATLK